MVNKRHRPHFNRLYVSLMSELKKINKINLALKAVTGSAVDPYGAPPPLAFPVEAALPWGKRAPGGHT